MGEQQKVDRRNYLKYAGAGVVVVAGAAAGAYYATKPGPATTTMTTGPATTSAPVELSLIAESVPPTFAIKDMAPNFEQLTGIQLNVEEQVYDTVIEKAFLDWSSGTQVYDAVSLPYEFLGAAVMKDYIIPVDDYLKNDPIEEPGDVIESFWKNTAFWKEKCYGYPSNTCTMFVAYRKDQVEDANEISAFVKKYGYEYNIPPVTWEEYRDMAEFFNRPDQGKYGVAIAGKRHAALVCEWLNYAVAFGGGLFDPGPDDGTLIANCEQNVKSLEYLSSLTPYAPPGFTTYTWDEVTAAFQQELVTMAIQWNDQMFAMEDPTKSKVSGKLGYSQIPVAPGGKPVSHFGPWCLVIPTKSKNPDGAYQFLKWLASKDMQIKLAKVGMTPSRISSFEIPELLNTIPFWKATGEALKIAWARPRIPEWAQMQEILMLGLSNAVTKQQTAQEALDYCQAEMERLFGGKEVHY